METRVPDFVSLWGPRVPKMGVLISVLVEDDHFQPFTAVILYDCYIT